MMAESTVLMVWVMIGIMVSSLGTGGVVKLVQAQQLSTNFYSSTCPSVETIVQSAMAAHFKQDSSIAAHILRMQFHDCAATGCDASLLLTGSPSEQEAAPNLTLLGFDVINDIKALVEATCTGVVSCSDILALAARDAVSLTGGPNFLVPLGRFDSTSSGGSNVNLPSADDSVSQTVSFFQNLGFSATELVVLLGAHTIGAAHCSSISTRMYNFQNSGTSDPSFDPTFLATLKTICPQGTSNTSATVSLDQQTPMTFDDAVYSQEKKDKGVLAIDEAIFTDSTTSGTVNQMSSNQTLFFQSFTAALIKMGQVGVLDSSSGNVRTNCSAVGTSPASAPAPSPSLGSDLSSAEFAPPPTSGG